MFKNNAKKLFDEAIERKKQAQKPVRIIVNKNNYDKLRADIDYVAMMCDVELEEEADDEQ